MQRQTMIVIASAFVLAGLAGAGAAVVAVDGQPATPLVRTTTTTVPTLVDVDSKDKFLKVLREQGVVRGPADEQVVYAEGDMYCRYLAEGLTTQKLMDNAGPVGSSERAKSERVLSAAVATLCPQHAPKLMPQS